MSTDAEAELEAWLASRADAPLAVAIVDVIAERPLARGLTALLGIRHESPQALLFRAGDVVWHDSHQRLTAATFAARVDGA